MVAHAREAEASAYLDWARDRGITVVRVLAMAQHLFQLTADDGIKALPRLLELASARGLHVEIVALADTAATKTDLEAHVKAVGGIAAKHGNALVEIANEPWHETQDPRLHDPAFVERLASLLHAEVPAALGSAETDTRYAAGRYATWHSPRSSGDEGWRHVTDLAAAAELPVKWRKPVVSDEPIGAGPQLAPGRRDNVPARFAAAAAMTRLAGLHPTFHYEAGLQARVAEGVELECLHAWLEGAAAVPGATDGQFLAGDAVAPIARVNDVRAVFARRTDREAVIVGIDARPGASVTPGNGWRVASRSLFRGLLVARLERVQHDVG